MPTMAHRKQQRVGDMSPVRHLPPSDGVVRTTLLHLYLVQELYMTNVKSRRGADD